MKLKSWMQSFFLAALNLAPLLGGAEVLEVRYPSVQHPYYAKRDAYFVTLLEMALERSGEPYRLVGVKLPDYSEKRSVLLLQSKQYDAHWLNTTPEREQELLPIRIPLDKGAIGWRAFLIRPDRQSVFDQIQSADDLKKQVFVQGHDWPDAPVLLENGFAVERSSNWQGLFRMVVLNRAQAFPRSILEISAEQSESVAEGLVIEKNLILRYPAAYYFFVEKNNLKLAAAIERGLKKSVADGSFDEFFFKNFGEPISDLNLQSRRVISIDYPALKIEDESLWFSKEWFEKIKAKHAGK
ncbi:diguanylate cyclase [Saccharophagus sp. K07]|nr:diguanylate cyclase [Saccharophagus sp. K07]